MLKILSDLRSMFDMCFVNIEVLVCVCAILSNISEPFFNTFYESVYLANTLSLYSTLFSYYILFTLFCLCMIYAREFYSNNKLQS